MSAILRAHSAHSAFRTRFLNFLLAGYEFCKRTTTHAEHPIYSASAIGAIQAEDLRRLTAQPPTVVVSCNGPYLGRLACKGNKPSSGPNHVFQLWNYKERNYRVEKEIGMWLILRLIMR